MKILNLNKTGNFFEGNKGFALMTVMFMTAILIMLVISLVSLTSQTLYDSTVGVERNSIMPIVESAVNEAILKLRYNRKWGKNNEKLFMAVGDQDVSPAGLEPGCLPEKNSFFDFQGKAFYYISFDKEDPAFNGTKYYSVNNLNSPACADGWRGKNKVPPYSASVVVTVAVGNTVKHVEVILGPLPEGLMQNGSRGQMKIKTNKFVMTSANKGKAGNLHSNYGSGDDISVAFSNLHDTEGKKMRISMNNNATVSATGTITSPVEPDEGDDFTNNELMKNIPFLTIDEFVQGLSFPGTLPSGTYDVCPGGLKYTPDGAPSPTYIYPNNTPITTGVLFEDGLLKISENVKIDYDPSHSPGKTGNFTLIDGGISFVTEGASIYAPSDDDTRDVSDPNAYLYGNIDISYADDKVLHGRGNIYAKGCIHIEGDTINGGITSESIALYSRGDISLRTENDTKFRGLVYTTGDFSCVVEDVGEVTKVKKTKIIKKHKKKIKVTDIITEIDYMCLVIEGALVVAGQENSIYDPGEISISSDLVKINFDDSVLNAYSALGGGASALGVLSWHEF